jgi:hypothetical protein
MKWFERYVVRLLLTRSGPIIQKAVTGIAAAAITYLGQKLGFDVTVFGVSEATVAAIVWGIIDIAVTKLPANIIKEYGEAIQKLLNEHSTSRLIKVDGFVGPKTLAAATAELSK